MPGSIRKHVENHKHLASDVIGSVSSPSILTGRASSGYDGYGMLPVIGSHEPVSPASLLSYIWGFENGHWLPVNLRIPTGDSFIRLSDQATGNFVDLSMLIIEGADVDPLFTIGTGTIVKKDLAAGGYVASEQGLIALGSGMVCQMEPPGAWLFHSGLQALHDIDSAASAPEDAVAKQYYINTGDDHLYYTPDGSNWLDKGDVDNYAYYLDTFTVRKNGYSVVIPTWASSPPDNPSVGDFYVDTDNDHLYKCTATTPTVVWTDKGVYVPNLPILNEDLGHLCCADIGSMNHNPILTDTYGLGNPNAVWSGVMATTVYADHLKKLDNTDWGVGQWSAGAVTTLDSTYFQIVNYSANNITRTNYGRFTNTGDMSLAGTLGWTPTSGRVLVMTHGSDGSGISSITQTGVTWSQVQSYASYGEAPYCEAEIWVGIVGSGASASFTITYDGVGYFTTTTSICDVIEYTGIDTSNPVDVHGYNGTTNTGSPTDTGTANTTEAADVIIGAIFMPSSVTQTTPLNDFTLISGAYTNGISLGTLELKSTVTGNYSSGTSTSGAKYIGLIAAFKAATQDTQQKLTMVGSTGGGESASYSAASPITLTGNVFGFDASATDIRCSSVTGTSGLKMGTWGSQEFSVTQDSTDVYLTVHSASKDLNLIAQSGHSVVMGAPLILGANKTLTDAAGVESSAGLSGRVLKINSSGYPVWSVDAVGTGGEGSYDQDLNTTNDVQFNSVTGTNGLKLGTWGSQQFAITQDATHIFLNSTSNKHIYLGTQNGYKVLVQRDLEIDGNLVLGVNRTLTDAAGAASSPSLSGYVLKVNGSGYPVWAPDATEGTGGGTYDQSLNTTDNVRFNNLTLTGSLGTTGAALSITPDVNFVHTGTVSVNVNSSNSGNVAFNLQCGGSTKGAFGYNAASSKTYLIAYTDSTLAYSQLHLLGSKIVVENDMECLALLNVNGQWPTFNLQQNGSTKGAFGYDGSKTYLVAYTDSTLAQSQLHLLGSKIVIENDTDFIGRYVNISGNNPVINLQHNGSNRLDLGFNGTNNYIRGRNAGDFDIINENGNVNITCSSGVMYTVGGLQITPNTANTGAVGNPTGVLNGRYYAWIAGYTIYGHTSGSFDEYDDLKLAEQWGESNPTIPTDYNALLRPEADDPFSMLRGEASTDGEFFDLMKVGSFALGCVKSLSKKHTENSDIMLALYNNDESLGSEVATLKDQIVALQNQVSALQKQLNGMVSA